MVALVVGCAVGGGLIGAALPEWLARLPEPEQPAEESKEPYAKLARAGGLRVGLGLLTAACFGGVAWSLGPSAALPAELYLAAVGVLLGYIDIRVRLLPNAIVLPSYLVVLGLLAGASLVSGQWSPMLWAVVSGAGLWLLFAIAGFAYPAGVGFGDIKLIGVLGLGLGWLGVGHALVGMMAAFVMGGLFSLGLVISRRATSKSQVPFGPFLVAGFLFAVLFADDLVRWYLFR